VPPVQQTPLESHIAITYWDENERLVVRSSTSVPYHVRRIIAPVIGLPPRRIRVVAPRVGGDFGAKQDVLIEDLCALLTIATHRPVRLEFTRAEELSSRARHAQIIRMKTGVKRDGTLVANSMMVLANTGAYGMHALSASRNTGVQTLPLYPCANLRFESQVVYTNQPPAGSFRGYGAPQGFFALESHLDEVARQLGMDALELRRKNWLKFSDKVPLVREFGASKEQIIQSSGLGECLRIVEEKVQWREKRGKGGTGRFRHGVGVALAMHGPAISGQEIAGASLTLNEDGSFYLLVGVVDSGIGSDTLLAQIAAEVLGVHVEDIVVHASDTDVVPFTSATSAYASAGAVKKVAEQVREQLLEVAGQMLKSSPAQLLLQDRVIFAPNGQSVTISQIALHTLYVENQRQIMATASWLSQQASPAFAAQGAEVEVDTESGIVRIIKAISAIEAGCTLHPLLTEGQIEGGAAQALGYGISEELVYDARGALLTANLSDYRILNAPDMPVMETYIVQTEDPSGPFGAKDGADISVDVMAPAVANAVADALGVRLRQLPLTPERVLRVLRAQAQTRTEK
jgi:putative selenate reductase molybdopterin-binding subunit